jgi:hypothetical protein
MALLYAKKLVLNRGSRRGTSLTTFLSWAVGPDGTGSWHVESAALTGGAGSPVLASVS